MPGTPNAACAPSAVRVSATRCPPVRPSSCPTAAGRSRARGGSSSATTLGDPRGGAGEKQQGKRAPSAPGARAARLPGPGRCRDPGEGTPAQTYRTVTLPPLCAQLADPSLGRKVNEPIAACGCNNEEGGVPIVDI